MKSSFLPLPHFILAATTACGLLTVSAFAQAPAPAVPATPAPAAPGVTPAVPGTTAAPGAPAATPAPKPLGPMEKNFIKNAGKSIYYQLELSKAAKSAAAADEKLKRVSETSLRDLTKAWDGINKLAKARGETLAAELTGGDKVDVERLAKLKDDKLIKQWLDDLSKEAKKLDKDFDSAAKNLQDPEIKTFASNYGPTVRSVFTSAEAAEKSYKPKK